MNDHSPMEKNEFSFLTSEENMPTENINKKNQISKTECEECLFLSDNEPELGDENNNDSITDAKKIKVELKIVSSNRFHVKGRIHKFLRKK